MKPFRFSMMKSEWNGKCEWMLCAVPNQSHRKKQFNCCAVPAELQQAGAAPQGSLLSLLLLLGLEEDLLPFISFPQGGLIAQPGPAEPQCLLGIAARKGLLSSSNVCSPSRGCFWVNLLSFELCKLSLRREKAISPFPLMPLLVEVAIHIYKNVLQWFHRLPPAETKLLQFWAGRIGSVLSFGNFVIVQIFIHFKTKTCNNSYILVILQCDLRTQCVILPKSNFAKRRKGKKIKLRHLYGFIIHGFSQGDSSSCVHRCSS